MPDRNKDYRSMDTPHPLAMGPRRHPSTPPAPILGAGSSKPNPQRPASDVNPLSRSCVDKAKEIHASIFSTNKEHKEAIIQNYYAVRCTFVDPLVSVTGTESVKQQYLFMTLFPKVTFRILNTTWTHLNNTTTTSHSIDITSTNELVIIDSLVTFTLLPYLPSRLVDIPLRIATHLKFNADGKVASHEDVWSVREFVGAFGFGCVGLVGEWVRRVNGCVSTPVIRGLVGLRAGLGVGVKRVYSQFDFKKAVA
ncbi:hypothetical protein HDU98_004361 [Podochytrium sp. JEL0797]|nr:hypothetical protein HDU98_004361 [Podochytrium sp. JEL0797]